MKRKLFYLVGLITLVALALAAGPAAAQTTANGPYYAWPSWDQTLPCTSASNCPRFIVLSNMGSAAVLDRETGLVWERSPSTEAFTWLDAQGHCTIAKVGDRHGWRLPTIQELASLLGPIANLRLPAGHPFMNVLPLAYWSATTNASDARRAWIVDFDFTGGLAATDKTVPRRVWCVRGGQGVDPQ